MFGFRMVRSQLKSYLVSDVARTSLPLCELRHFILLTLLSSLPFLFLASFFPRRSHLSSMTLSILVKQKQPISTFSDFVFLL